MTLENLERIGKLQRHDTSAGDVARLLQAVTRNLADARHEDISHESRFDMAYKAIQQLAMIALMAHGYRHSTNVPGHHATTIQTLVWTVDLPGDEVRLLDKFRVRRNTNDYLGADISEEEVAAALRAAARLGEDVNAWLRKHRPDLLA